MARSSMVAIIAVFGLIALSFAATTTAPAATDCKYAVTAAQNGSNVVVRVNSSNAKCAPGVLTVNSLFPNDTVLSHELYESSDKNVSTVTVTADRVASKAFLDGGVCVTVSNNTQHVCHLAEKNSGLHYILKATTETKDGGSFVNGTVSIDAAGVVTPSTELSVFQSCGNYTSKIKDFTQTVIIGSSNDVQKLGNLKDLTLLYAVVKTKHLPDYKVVDFTNGTSKPFSTIAPVQTTATAADNSSASANGTANSTLRAVAGSVTYTKPDGTTVTLQNAPQCYSLGITFEKLLRNPDATCYLVGCDLILIMTDGKATYNVQTNGLESAQFEMTKLAVGLIVGIVVGVLVLCSCLIGIIFLCRKKTGEHQPLVNH
jgi:hypothetical protein